MGTTCCGAPPSGSSADWRDKTRLLTGLFAFFAPLQVAIRDDISGAAPRSSWCSTESTVPQAAGLDHCGIAWIELEYAEADDVIATGVHATTASRPVIIMSRD